MMRRILYSICIAVLVLACAGLLLSHLRPVSNETSLCFSAAARSDERMRYPWPNGSINPNTASLAELDLLAGVGPVIAQRIVDERMQNGLYAYPEDLIAVNGIGPKTLQKLWNDLSLPYPPYQ